MTVTREQGLANAMAQKFNRVRMCAAETRGWFGIGALGDYDGDGAADAEDMWKAAKQKHPGDRNPPAGVPVYWGGGSADNGHISVAVGNGMIRSTDAGGAGIMGTVPLSFPEEQWGMPYLGWSEDLYGNTIPSEAQAKVAELIARWSAKRRLLKTKLARARARKKEMQ